jgi:hypothetical protein
VAWWQVYALFLAVATPVGALVGMLRSRRWSHAVLLAQVCLVLEIGFIVYGLSPGPEPQLSLLLDLAIGLFVLDILAMGWALYRRQRLLRGPITVAQLDHANGRAITSRLLTVLAASALLLNFEPWLGVANLAGNALWICLWIPKRMREYGIDVAVEIAAPRQSVFSYLTDPEKWPLYRQSSTQRGVTKVKPPGPLAVGSKIESQMPVSLGRHVKGYLVSSTSEVTALTPDTAYSTVWTDRPEEHSEAHVDNVPSGTVLQFHLHGVLPFMSSTMGAMLDVRGVIAARRAEIAGTYSRLKLILERLPNQ